MALEQCQLVDLVQTIDPAKTLAWVSLSLAAIGFLDISAWFERLFSVQRYAIRWAIQKVAILIPIRAFMKIFGINSWPDVVTAPLGIFAWSFSAPAVIFAGIFINMLWHLSHALCLLPPSQSPAFYPFSAISIFMPAGEFLADAMGVSSAAPGYENIVLILTFSVTLATSILLLYVVIILTYTLLTILGWAFHLLSRPPGKTLGTIGLIVAAVSMLFV